MKKSDVQSLRKSLYDLIGVMNRPQPDIALIAEAGINLDRALFPLLTRIEMQGPIGVGELADLVGRDYSTVSRQVAKLESLGLVNRQSSAADARVREATISEKGRTMTEALDAARHRLFSATLADWDEKDLRDLIRLVRQLADSALQWKSGE
jgi:DNA-binding MarR family transcriptional regulator